MHQIMLGKLAFVKPIMESRFISMESTEVICEFCDLECSTILEYFSKLLTKKVLPLILRHNDDKVVVVILFNLLGHLV